MSKIYLTLFAFIFAISNAFAQDKDTKAAPPENRQVYFGEEHLHTTTSVDAYIQGNHKNTIEDAFNYNKGLPVTKYLTGETLQRRTPYDWTAVTDHAEYMGVFGLLSDPNSPIANDPIVKKILSGDPKQMDEAFVTLANTLTSGNPYPPIFGRSENHRNYSNKTII